MVTLITCLQNSDRLEGIERSFALSFVDLIRSSNRTIHCSPVPDTRESTLRKSHEGSMETKVRDMCQSRACPTVSSGHILDVNGMHCLACPASMLMCAGLWIPTCLSKFNVICVEWYVMTCLHTPLYMCRQCEGAWWWLNGWIQTARLNDFS
jgi:hypothetical protein